MTSHPIPNLMGRRAVTLARASAAFLLLFRYVLEAWSGATGQRFLPQWIFDLRGRLASDQFNGRMTRTGKLLLPLVALVQEAGDLAAARADLFRIGREVRNYEALARTVGRYAAWTRAFR